MTTPGGVPNLPLGALTVGTMASKLQDMTASAMHGRAAERMPSVFDTSNGGNMASDLSPFGILTSVWAAFNSAVANADPSDIQGPQDLPGLLIDFIEGLPLVGEFVGLMEAILGTYDGDDDVLLAIQAIFEPIRRLLQVITGKSGVDLPTAAEIAAGWEDLGDAITAAVTDAQQAIRDALTGIVNATPTDLDNWLLDLLTGSSDLNAAKLTNLANIGTIAQAKISGLLSDLAAKAQQSDLTALVSGLGLADWAHLITDLVSTRSTASSAATQSNFQSLLNNLFDGSSGSTGSTGKTLANVLTALAQIFDGLIGNISDTAALDGRVGALENSVTVTGDGATDDFSYASAANLSSPYVSYTSGSGAGSMGPNGSGKLVWKSSGGTTFTNTYRKSGTGATAKLKMIISKVPEGSAFGGGVNILGRVNSSGNGVAVAYFPGGVTLYNVTAGALSSTIGSSVSNSSSAGDVLEFRHSGTSVRVFVSGRLLIDNASSGYAGSSYTHVLFGGGALGATFYQIKPGEINSLTIGA